VPLEKITESFNALFRFPRKNASTFPFYPVQFAAIFESPDSNWTPNFFIVRSDL